MKYALEIECLDKAVECLNQVRFWLERMADHKDEPLPTNLKKLEAELSETMDRLEGKVLEVNGRFRDEHGYYRGVHIHVWNPDKPKRQTEQRAYIRPPGRLCDEPHMTKVEWETLNHILGCEQFVYDEDFDVYVMEGKRVLKVLKGKGAR